MRQPPEGRRRAVLARDGAVRRLRRATHTSIAAMVALGGAFAALAAGSTHTKNATVHRTSSPPPAANVVQAPAPPLVGAQSAEAAPPAQAPPVQAPAPSYQPPVVSSGGS